MPLAPVSQDYTTGRLLIGNVHLLNICSVGLRDLLFWTASRAFWNRVQGTEEKAAISSRATALTIADRMSPAHIAKHILFEMLVNEGIISSDVINATVVTVADRNHFN